MASWGVGIVLVLGLTGSADAYLGSFAPADGYQINVPVGAFNWSDVSYYNAGAHGPNAGGGPGPTLIAPDSGNWKVIGEVGGYFTSSAARSAVVSASPPYPSSVANTLPIYMVGNHFPGRGGDGSNLAFRNDSPTGTGAAVYEYSIDTYDTGGVNPASVTGGTVTTQFYFCPNPSDPPSPDGRPLDKFRLSFRDSLGNTGVEWGYTRDNQVAWRTGAGPWNYPGIIADAADWDGLRVDIDLTADTFEMRYFDVSASAWLTLAPAGTPLGAAMQDLTVLRWRLEDGVSTGIGGKNFFDDFSFNIPAPSAGVLGALAVLVAGRRRR